MLLLLASTDVLGSQSSTVSSSARRDTCRYGSWSKPRWLERPTSFLAATRLAAAAVSGAAPAQGGRASVRAPVRYAAGVAGFLAIKFAGSASPTQWPPQLRAIRLDGPSAGGPAGAFWFAYPRAAIDNDGTLHVVWAEPDDKLPTDPALLHGTVPELRSLWHATLHSGTWSPAKRIYRGERLQWDEVNASRLVVDGRNGLHIAFVGDDSAGPAVVYLRSEGAFWGRWRFATSIRAGPIYLDLAIDGERRAAIAFVEPALFTLPRPNVLFLTQSFDAGRTWTRPLAVSAPDEDPAIEPHVFLDRDSAVQLEWVQQSLGGFTGGNLWHTVLAETGRRSTSALPLPSNVITSHSQAAIDACGTIHVMTQAYPNGRSELQYARVTSGGWSTWSRPFDGTGAHASLAADGAMVHVVWDLDSRSPVDGAARSGLAHATLPVFGPGHEDRRR